MFVKLSLYHILIFFRNAFGILLLNSLPDFIETWIVKEILPQYQTSKLSGPWNTTVKTPVGDIAYKASVFSHDCETPVLVITIQQNESSGSNGDFQILSRIGITKREIETLSYLPLGYTNQQIATAMEISVSGVKKHLKNLNKKLDAAGRLETLLCAMSLREELASQL